MSADASWLCWEKMLFAADHHMDCISCRGLGRIVQIDLPEPGNAAPSRGQDSNLVD